MCRNGMNRHILNNLEWVPMMNRGMEVLMEVKWKKTDFLYVLRVCHELRNMINSVLYMWSQKRKTKTRKNNVYCINGISYFNIILSITDISMSENNNRSLYL